MHTHVHMYNSLLASEASLQASEAPSLVMKMEARDILSYIYIYLYVYVRQLSLRMCGDHYVAMWNIMCRKREVYGLCRNEFNLAAYGPHKP